MADTLFRDGNNNLGQLKTLTASDGSTLPQSAPSDSTGLPYGVANPLPVAIAGIAQVQMNGQGPLPVEVSVSVTAANPVEAPDYPLPVGGAGLGHKLNELIIELRMLNIMFAEQCGYDIDDVRDNMLHQNESSSSTTTSISSATSSYTN
jgi:hypothetical protein